MKKVLVYEKFTSLIVQIKLTSPLPTLVIHISFTSLIVQIKQCSLFPRLLTNQHLHPS